MKPANDCDSDLNLLKRLAQEMDDLFSLALPDAPGMAFVGARFTVANGQEGGPPQSFSAGAADPDRGRAFRRCMGEVAETLAQFLSRHGGTPPPLTERCEGLAEAERAAMAEMVDMAEGPSAWVGAVRMADGSPSCVPSALCFRDLGVAPPSGTSLSLGCAAGATVGAASLSALLELIERDAMALWWRGGLAATRLEPDALDATVSALLEKMRAGATGRATWFLDLTTDLGVPVVAALSANADGADVAQGFAAGTSLPSAARSALCELAQTELGNRMVRLKQDQGIALSTAEIRQGERIARLSADMAALAGDASGRRHNTFVECGDGEAVQEISVLLARNGVSAHIVDLSGASTGIPAVKIVAPELQPAPGKYISARLSTRLRIDDDLREGFSRPDLL